MANRLIDETSPYLLQHAHNPVDWYPWGEDAFEAARQQNKPILLSVGYSACHWCHVMERESFEDADIAARMNEGFVNVKVDREERPDVDELYMRAVQAFNDGRGGWPMTVFLTPDGKPFFGGTYYPPQPRHGLPGFVDVLEHVRTMWTDRRDSVDTMVSDMIDLLRRSGGMPQPASVLTRDWLDPVVRAAERQYDPHHAGFGGAPKFPPHGTLQVLLAHHHRTGEPESLDMATETLDAMARGGMYDLLAGGFSRYSVDAQWRVPHFEKMLYDNGQLVGSYVDAWRLTGRTHYARVVRETIGWALREMRLDHGGFAASQDADSEGHEGTFFVWTVEQLAAVLGEEGAATVAPLLQVTPEGTFEAGSSVLRLEEPLENHPPDVRELLEDALARLYAAREARPRPTRDDKVITSWNGLMISALARAGAALGEPAWVEAAERAADFVLAECVVEGRLMRTYKDGRAHVPAYADDHMNLVTACLDLWDATFDTRWLDAATTWTGTTLDLFWDDEQGGLFYSGSDQPELVHRSKNFLGGAEPAANGTAALALVRLGRLAGRQELVDKAERIVRAAQPLLAQAPRALGAEAVAGAWLADGGQEVAIVGDPGDAATQALLAEMRQHLLPFAVLYCGADPDAKRDAARLPWLEGKGALNDRPTAYVCEAYTCKLPVHDADALRDQLQETRSRELGPATPEESRQLAPPLPSDVELWLGTDVPCTLEALRGQVVILDFWTYCCINCHHVLPELHALQQRYANQPFAVVGVHSAKFDAEKHRGNVEMAMQRHQISHPVVLDGEHAIWEAYGVRSWPTLVVLDSEGRVAALRSGESSAEQLADIVDTLLDEGRAAGTLAEAPEPAERPIPAPHPAPLRFPGKIHVWPDAWDQEMGARMSSSARVYLSDSGNHRILEARIDTDREGWPRLTVTRSFGSGEPGLVDGAAGEARFRGPQGVRRFEGTLYVADTENHAVRAVDLETGIVSTLAGTGSKGTVAPEPEALRRPTEVALRSPWSVEVMPFRDHHIVFVAMAGSHQIWAWAQVGDAGHGHLGIHAGSGREEHIDGPAAVAALAQPSDLALYGRYLLFVDSEVSSVRAVDLQSHQVVTVVGRGLFDFGDVDGPPDVARLQHPLGLTFAGETVYVADTYNHKVRAIGLADGNTRTLVGGDPEQLREPGGIARAGRHLLIADTSSHRIRAVAVSGGELRTVAVDYSALD